jgi:hypothetical protein
MLIGLAVWGAAIVLICCTMAIASSRRDRAERRALRAVGAEASSVEVRLSAPRSRTVHGIAVNS